MLLEYFNLDLASTYSSSLGPTSSHGNSVAITVPQCRREMFVTV